MRSLVLTSLLAAATATTTTWAAPVGPPSTFQDIFGEVLDELLTKVDEILPTTLDSTTEATSISTASSVVNTVAISTELYSFYPDDITMDLAVSMEDGESGSVFAGSAATLLASSEKCQEAQLAEAVCCPPKEVESRARQRQL